MSMRKILSSSSKRAVVLTSLAALVLTMAEPQLAAAGQLAPSAKGVTVTASSDATDFSSAARRRRTVRRGGGNAAGLAFMGMAIGTIAGIAAQQQRQDDYNNYYNNGYGNGYAPGYYGGGPYYGRRYYGY
jgi:hypothetical protein